MLCKKDLAFILVDNFEIFGPKYGVRGIIAQPFVGHYNAMIINVQETSFLIEKGKNYYYDDTMNNNEIIEIINWKNWLKSNMPTLAIYERID